VDILYKDESYRIMGACFEVYKEMGCGFLEAVYQECLDIEFTLQGLLFRPQTELKLVYKGRTLQQTYIPDFILFEKIVLEIKAVSNRRALSCDLHLPSACFLSSFFRVFRVFRG
jgi:GxxExxY protein